MLNCWTGTTSVVVSLPESLIERSLLAGQLAPPVGLVVRAGHPICVHHQQYGFTDTVNVLSPAVNYVEAKDLDASRFFDDCDARHEPAPSYAHLHAR